MPKLKKPVQPRPIDLALGQRVRLLRLRAGLTQTNLAHRCGVTFQQIQKYETGVNRVSVSRLFDIAKAVDLPVTDFIVDLERGYAAKT